MFKPLLTIIMLSIVTTLIGCGTTGALYIPEQRYPMPDDTQQNPVTMPDNQPTK